MPKITEFELEKLNLLYEGAEMFNNYYKQLAVIYQFDPNTQMILTDSGEIVNKDDPRTQEDEIPQFATEVFLRQNIVVTDTAMPVTEAFKAVVAGATVSLMQTLAPQLTDPDDSARLKYLQDALREKISV